MSSNERLRLAMPNGELRRDVLFFMKAIGLNFPDPGRNYFIEVDKMPLDLIIVRASDVARIVYDDKSQCKTGITGSDLLWEAGYKDCGMQLPVGTLYPEAKKWSLHVGITKAFREYISQRYERGALLQDLNGTMMATAYPHIAADYLAEHNLDNVKVFPVGGTDEAIQYVYPNCYSVLGLYSSGATSRANGLQVLDMFHQGTIKMIEEQDGMSRLHVDTLNDLKEKIARSIEQARP